MNGAGRIPVAGEKGMFAMYIPKCPGRDQRFWKPSDIFEVACRKCGGTIEFWKDDIVRRCKGCGLKMRNPKLDLGCAKRCKFADKCLGLVVENGGGRDKSE